MSEAGLNLQISEAAKRQLAEEGFDPAYGARPLKRIIQQRLANSLATALLEARSAPVRRWRSTGTARSSPSSPPLRRLRQPVGS